MEAGWRNTMEVRERILKAVEALNYRVTVGDVSASSGLELALAQQGLNTLAQDVNGHLQVSSSGEIVYAFERDLRNRLVRNDLRSKLVVLARQVWKALFYVVRISFGILLVLSLLVIAVAVFVILTSTRGNDDQGGGSDRRDPGFAPSFFWFDPWFIFLPPDAPRQARPKRMGFLEGVFSFLFGDSDPNADLEERRWRTVGGVIRNQGGVVIAEQLAPYLDQASTENEDFVLPALVKFDGQPEVSEQGDIVYRFPGLQTLAGEQSNERAPSFLQETSIPFSQAGSGNLALAAGLGALNFGGAWWLYFLLQNAALPPELQFVEVLLPVLLVYGTLFLAIPAVRWLILQQRNSRIRARNRTRSEFAQLLRTLNTQLKQKLDYARLYAQRKVIAKDDIIYTTEQSTLEQRDYELDDPRFKELEGR